jgi:hypothetical protein|tara:strand:+ start:27 stop:524 length:498 start_codon:yes stop_codon:yes gene_type:complete
MDIDKLKAVPLENIYDIFPNVYLLHPTGGYHYFNQCSLDKNINQIYRQNIWPWIETLETNFGILKKDRFPRPTTRDTYPKLNLRVIGNKKNNTYPIKTFYMHLLVAKCFIENKNNFPVVDHKNSIACDYRLDNLRWVSYSENNSGKRPAIGPDKMYDIHNHKGSV